MMFIFIFSLFCITLVSSWTYSSRNGPMNQKWDTMRVHKNLFLFHVSLKSTSSAIRTTDVWHSHLRRNQILASSSLFGSQVCSASLISSNHLLTSAQCVLYKTATDFQAVISYVLHSILEIHVHPDHVHNDVAVLKMTPPFATHQRVFNVLLQKKPLTDDSISILTGWNESKKELNSFLQLEQMQCLDSISCTDRHDLVLEHNQFCGINKKAKGVCKGNVGSPLISYNMDQNLVRLIGIMSHSGMCSDEYPVVFTNISQYVSWIRSKCDNCILF